MLFPVDTLRKDCHNSIPFIDTKFVVVVQSLHRVQLFGTPWTVAHQVPLSSTISQSLLKFMPIELVMLSNYLIIFCPLLFLPSVFPSIGLFQWVDSLHQVAKVLELVSATVIPVKIQGWFPLGLTGLILQSKSLLQHHSLKASILWHSAFFMVQLSHLYMTTGKTIALTIWTFVGNVMSLLFITL